MLHYVCVWVQMYVHTCTCSQGWVPGVLVVLCLRVGCGVVGLGFLPLQLVCYTHVFSCTYGQDGLWVGI